MTEFHLAQFNVATLRFPLDSPEMADFMAALDPINALADGTGGFVWRYVEDGRNDSTSTRPYDDDRVIVNFTVWETREQLWEFVYKSRHMEVLRRRREWFSRTAELDQVLWWIPAGTIPTVQEGMRRLALVRAQGPKPEAFTFRDFYEPATSMSP